MNYLKAYQDIHELPIYNWFKVISDNNFGFLLKDSTNIAPKKVKNNSSDDLVNLWFDLNNQYIDEFGQDESHLNILEKKRDLGILYGEFLETGNKMKLTQIEIKESELKIFDNDEKFNPTREIGIISKHIGAIIDTRKTSVYQYYTIKETLKDG